MQPSSPRSRDSSPAGINAGVSEPGVAPGQPGSSGASSQWGRFQVSYPPPLSAYSCFSNPHYGYMQASASAAFPLARPALGPAPLMPSHLLPYSQQMMCRAPGYVPPVMTPMPGTNLGAGVPVSMCTRLDLTMTYADIIEEAIVENKGSANAQQIYSHAILNHNYITTRRKKEAKGSEVEMNEEIDVVGNDSPTNKKKKYVYIDWKRNIRRELSVNRIFVKLEEGQRKNAHWKVDYVAKEEISKERAHRPDSRKNIHREFLRKKSTAIKN